MFIINKINKFLYLQNDLIMFFMAINIAIKSYVISSPLKTRLKFCTIRYQF